MTYYQHHLFFCTQQRAEGVCCGQAGIDARQYTKDLLKAQGRHGPGKSRVSAAGCLGRCKQGPCLVVYPEGAWYTYQTQADLDEILEKVLEKGGVVDRLLIKDLAD